MLGFYELQEEYKRVQNELRVSNARIVELAQEIELLKNGLPFAGEVKEVLEGFSVFDDLVSLGHIEEFTVPKKNKISPLGSSSDADREFELFTRANSPDWDSSTTYFGGEEVMFNGKKCVMGAGVGNIPISLNPDGMVYDKESDSLIKKDLK